MNKTFLTTASLLGALSVALGAFAAHALKEKLNPENLAVFETGVRYMFFHVFALLGVGILTQFFQGNLFKWSGRLFIIGIILFSGSLFALSMILQNGLDHLRWIGAVTPVGGLCFIAGWLLLATAITKSVR